MAVFGGAMVSGCFSCLCRPVYILHGAVVGDTDKDHNTRVAPSFLLKPCSWSPGQAQAVDVTMLFNDPLQVK